MLFFPKYLHVNKSLGELNNERNTSKVETTSLSSPAFRIVIPNKSGRLLVTVIDGGGGGGGGGGGI